MGFRISVKGEEPDKVDINKLLTKRDRFTELRSTKFGLGMGFSLALVTGLISIISLLGVFPMITEKLFEVYGLSISYGIFGVVIAMFYSFALGFLFGTISAFIYDMFI